jgi:hypothetical protein
MENLSTRIDLLVSCKNERELLRLRLVELLSIKHPTANEQE